MGPPAPAANRSCGESASRQHRDPSRDLFNGTHVQMSSDTGAARTSTGHAHARASLHCTHLSLETRESSSRAASMPICVNAGVTHSATSQTVGAAMLDARCNPCSMHFHASNSIHYNANIADVAQTQAFGTRKSNPGTRKSIMASHACSL